MKRFGKESKAEEMTETPAEKAVSSGHSFNLAKAIAAHRGGHLHVHLHLSGNEPGVSSELPHIASARNADELA